MTGTTAPTFWTWSLARYDEDGVAPRLLHLQNTFALNVNLLLWCGWCAERYKDLPDLAMRKAIDLTSRWSGEIAGALRSARRLLKTPPPQADIDAAQRLRSDVKAAELAAEKVEQDMLCVLAAETLTPLAGDVDAAGRCRRNLATYAALAGAAKREGFSVSLLAELAARIVPGADPQHPENTRHA